MNSPPANAAPATSIDDVLARLDSIRKQCIERRSRIGYFAAVYWRITQRVRQAIDRKLFDDGPWVEKLDVAFANRYFLALDNFQTGVDNGRAWTLAFHAAARRRPVILQHVLLGINAHINLDLGIATADCADGDLSIRERDFVTVNECASLEVRDLQGRLAGVSLLAHVFDELNGDKQDGTLVNFGIDRAREQAWQAAQLLTCVQSAERDTQLRVLDRNAAALGRLILDPPGLIPHLTLRLVRLAEFRSVPSVIGAL